MKLKQAMELSAKLGHSCVTKKSWMKPCEYAGTKCHFICFNDNWKEWISVTELKNGNSVCEMLVGGVNLSEKDWIPYFDVAEKGYVN